MIFWKETQRLRAKFILLQMKGTILFRYRAQVFSMLFLFINKHSRVITFALNVTASLFD